MSANTNETTGSVEISPVEWAKKGNKISFGSILELTPDPILNIRFRQGSEFFGIKNTTDTLDIPSMKQQIVEGNGILEPLLVSVRKDNVKIPLRGNRRTYAGQELANDPTTSAELRKVLTERTPMILLHGLTPEQEHELIQDQTQKPFLRSEVIRAVFQLRKDKWSFDRIAMLMWETIGRFSGNAKKIAEIRDLTDPGVKKEKIKGWLRGTLDNYIIWGYDLGSFVQKCILLSAMRTDGIKTDENPYFNAEKNSQKRIAALKKAKDLDGNKFSGQIPAEGSEFKKVLDQFHSEDYGTAQTVTPAKGPKMMQRKDIEGMKDAFQSKIGRGMIQRILGEEVPTLNASDDFATVCETKEMLVEQYLPRLKPEIAAIVRLCLVSPDPTDFQKFLELNVVAEEEKTEEKTEVA